MRFRLIVTRIQVPRVSWYRLKERRVGLTLLLHCLVMPSICPLGPQLCYLVSEIGATQQQVKVWLLSEEEFRIERGYSNFRAARNRHHPYHIVSHSRAD